MLFTFSSVGWNISSLNCKLQMSGKVCLRHSGEQRAKVYVATFSLLCGAFAPYLGTQIKRQWMILSILEKDMQGISLWWADPWGAWLQAPRLNLASHVGKTIFNSKMSLKTTKINWKIWEKAAEMNSSLVTKQPWNLPTIVCRHYQDITKL